jgi:predicted alpha/beta superfamily hydrolase
MLTADPPISYYGWRPGVHTVRGNVVVFPEVHSPQLGNARPIVVYLPPSHGLDARRYPVLYMHDGQNLFDAGTSAFGIEWGVDETMQALAREGIEAIVVGIWHMEDRQHEYSPFSNGRGSAGDAYLEFLVKTVRPLVNRTFRTRCERRHTGILGSSLGGLISTYGYLRYPKIFGMLGAFSPSYWAGRGAIYRMLADVSAPPGRAYFDNSTHETSARRMFNHFRKDFGYTPEVDLRYVEDPDGAHDESAWAARFPAAVRFLLGE